jgi:hypothetical protein
LTLSGDQLLTAHAAKCANCARLLSEYESVEDSVKLLPDEIEKILSEAREFDVTNGLSSLVSRHFALIASLAALLVIGFGFFDMLDSGPAEIARQEASSVSPMILNTQPIPFVKSEVNKPPHKTLDTSPFSPNFSMANSITLISLPSVPSWDDVSKKLDPLEPVIIYSAEIPGIRPMQCSLNATLQLLKKSFSKSEPEIDPDLGFSAEQQMLVAA